MYTNTPHYYSPPLPKHSSGGYRLPQNQPASYQVFPPETRCKMQSNCTLIPPTYCTGTHNSRKSKTGRIYSYPSPGTRRYRGRHNILPSPVPSHTPPHTTAQQRHHMNVTRLQSLCTPIYPRDLPRRHSSDLTTPLEQSVAVPYTACYIVSSHRNKQAA